METGMDFKKFQKMMNDIMRDEEPKEEKKCKCECGCESCKEKGEHMEDLHMKDLHKLVDELMMELGFHRADEQPYPQKVDIAQKTKTIKCCPVCYGGNLVRGMKLYRKVAEKDAIKFYEIPVVYCPTCGRKLGEDK